jgi:hypothetical protein
MQKGFNFVGAGVATAEEANAIAARKFEDAAVKNEKKEWRIRKRS